MNPIGMRFVIETDPVAYECPYTLFYSYQDAVNHYKKEYDEALNAIPNNKGYIEYAKSKLDAILAFGEKNNV